MSKFKKGDYVTLREDARYPQDEKLWSTIDDKLIPGELFKVSCSGRYSWIGKPEQDCVGLENNNSGWIPEICFDPVQIQHFEEGDWVECYRLPNEHDWCVTNCGKINHELKVGEKYQVLKSSTVDNIEILINSRSEGWYPPTVFRKTTLPVQELPQKWKVKCKASNKDTPELREWRGMEWTCTGYITNDKIWNFPDFTSDRYIEISYETFLEKVYKPWKASQPVKESVIPLLLLPEKWHVKCTDNPNDTPELFEWRGSEWGGSHGVIKYNKLWKFEKIAKSTEISYDDFLKLVYNPWKKSQVNNKLPEHWYIPCTVENFEELQAYYSKIDHDHWKLKDWHILLSKHPDDSSSYWNSSENHLNRSYPEYVKITLEQFRAITGSKPIVKKEIPDKWAYQLEADDLELTEAWRLTQKIPSAYDKKVFCVGEIIVPEWWDGSGYTSISKSSVEINGFTFISKELYRSIIKADLNKSNAQDQYSIGNTVKSELINKTPQSTTYSYKVTPPDHIPSIITGRSKPKLLCTDVEELNVNVNII